MSLPPNRVEITSSAIWRLLPQGMRRRWWLFRLFDGLARGWPRWPRGRRRRGVLVIRMDGIGDMILFRQSLDHYAEAFGVTADQITVLGCDSWAGIAADVFAGYRVITINEHRYARRLFYRLSVNFHVRGLAPAITVADAYFRRALMSDSLARVANAPRTIVALPYMNERTRAEYTWYMSQGWEVINTGAYPDHEAVRHATFISAIAGRKIAPATPAINWREVAPPLPQKEEKEGEGIAPPYVVLNPGANEYGRRWPLADYAALAVWLRGQGLGVVFVGKAEEKAEGGAGEKAGESAGGVIDMTGRSTLPVLLDIIKGAALMVSNDTGPAHVAIALGTKTVVIIGGGHFGCFVPYPPGVAPDHARFVHEYMDCYHCFWRCHKRDDPTASFPCVAAVSMDKVRRACAELLVTGDAA